jgi:hypothetical protein
MLPQRDLLDKRQQPLRLVDQVVQPQQAVVVAAHEQRQVDQGHKVVVLPLLRRDIT